MTNEPLRRRLFLLVAAGIAPVALVSGIALLAFYQSQREQSHRAGLDITRALATAVDSEARRTISVLEVLATSPLLDTEDLAGFKARAERALASQPQWRLVVLSQPDGTPLINTRYPDGPLPPLNDAPSFQRAVKEGRPVVGDLARGPHGEWAVPVRLPIERGGKLRYVITAVVSPDIFLEIVQRQHVPRDWVVSIFDSKGQRIARSRDAQFLAQQAAPELRALVDTGAPEGMAPTRTIEGDLVFSAYTRLKEPQWVVAVGLPVTLVEVGAAQSLAVYGGGVILSVVLGLVVAGWVARSVNEPMGRLRAAAHALGRGEPVELPATEIRELQDVGDALVNSSRARRRHEEERDELLRRERGARAFAEAANKSKDEFLAMLGHELRNPLGAISNAASLANDPRSSEGTRRQAGEIIARQVGHLTRLTDDLLDAARALTGKIVLERQRVDLAALVAQGLRTLGAAGRTQKHRVEQALQPVWVDVDPIRLDQIVSNLIGNAVKYTPANGEIRVSVAREGADAVLRVRDNGIGLTPELAARAFDLFVQGNRDLDRSLGGLGIGLTLVRRLAEMHGGSVDVKSEGPDRGSEFIVRLPAVEPPAERAAEEKPRTEAPRCDVLVVEDNDDARETLQMMLEIAGHRVRSANDGPAGLQAAIDTHPDVMLVDIGLPKMDGYEVARRVRSAMDGDRPYLIAVTGYGTPEDRQRAMDAGFDTHIVKPVDFDKLTEHLAKRRP
jgi:signal transduction histidine kinase/CheY-like chemotaxis protein